MSEFPSIDAQRLLEDPRYAAYAESLREKREKYMRALINARDQERSERLRGQILALEYALGLPAELLTADPQTTTSNP